MSSFSMLYGLFQGSTQPLSHGVRGVNEQGCEADHSPQTSTIVKNTWICAPTPAYAFMA